MCINHRWNKLSFLISGKDISVFQNNSSRRKKIFLLSSEGFLLMENNPFEELPRKDKNKNKKTVSFCLRWSLPRFPSYVSPFVYELKDTLFLNPSTSTRESFFEPPDLPKSFPFYSLQYSSVVLSSVSVRLLLSNHFLRDIVPLVS